MADQEIRCGVLFTMFLDKSTHQWIHSSCRQHPEDEEQIQDVDSDQPTTAVAELSQPVPTTREQTLIQQLAMNKVTRPP